MAQKDSPAQTVPRRPAAVRILTDGVRTLPASHEGERNVALTPVDKALLQRCLNHAPGAWNEFVDRFLGLIYHVVQHTAYQRSIPLRPEDAEDFVAEVLLQIVANDYAVLRSFRGNASLSTYLTVIARRICVHELTRRAAADDGQKRAARPVEEVEEPRGQRLGLERLEEVERLLGRLSSRDREVVRLHYLEGRSYEEISTQLGIPVNSIGPILARARKKLRESVKNAPPVQRDIRPRTPDPNAS